MAKKLSGIDLNGVQDYAARNWVKDKSGEDVYQEQINYGSSRSTVISLETSKGPEYIGGVQADLAPHGRGEGYGRGIGDSKFRTTLTEIISAEVPDLEKLKASILGITSPSDYVVCGISDSIHTTEAYQDALLSALRVAKFKTPLLVWRSVLTALSMLRDGNISEPCTVGLINHSNCGFDVQKLNFKPFEHSDRSVFVPERKQLGESITASIGYNSLFELGASALESLNTDRFLDIQQSKNIAALGLGRSVKPELLRRKTGLWAQLVPPPELENLNIDLQNCNRRLNEITDGCDHIVFETLTEGRLKSRIHRSLEQVLGREVKVIYDDAIARAALFAAERLEQDIPIYFDYLPQISTIVQVGLEAKTFDLIDRSKTLRAGRVYRSASPAILGTQSGQQVIDVFLRKEGEEKPRQATIELPVKSKSSCSVSVSVEQTPAQGSASIQINSIDLGLSTIVNLEKSKKLETSWEDLLRSMLSNAVIMPERMVLPAFIDNWESGVDGGLTSVVDREVKRQHPDWAALEKRIARAISSDGKIPFSINSHTNKNLLLLTDLALKHFNARLAGSVVDDNLSLRFLTWQFKRCPQEVCEHLMELWKHFGEANFHHVLVRGSMSWNLIFQGVGRAVFDPKLEKRALLGLLNIPIQQWHWEAQTACASFLVSRSKTAHKLLDDGKISILLDRVFLEFKTSYGTDYFQFRYTPFLLAGLLRYRELDPQFLVFGNDARAEIIVAIIEETLDDIRTSRKIKKPKDRKKYTYWLTDIIKFIKCEGGNPKLLMDISNNDTGNA